MSKPPDDAPMEVWLEWMDYLDKLSMSLLDEIVVIVKRLHLREDFIITRTPLERKHLLKIVNDILKEEEKQKNDIDKQARKMRATRKK